MSSLPSVSRVAQAFSQAAEHYDQVAGLQRQVADHLLKHCHTQLNGVVMDLGCGTGYVAKHLAQLTPVTSVLGIDIAPGMIDWCRQHIAYPRCQWMVADAQALPVADNSIDNVVSSLAIQWCADERALFANTSRVLKPAAIFLLPPLVLKLYMSCAGLGSRWILINMLMNLCLKPIFWQLCKFVLLKCR
ncbi:MAG TPA: hypothetical protein DE276_08415 [Oceanospirillaceae bacterium]|nr:hypothetical protein [Oceanospirillaceae bacterium]